MHDDASVAPVDTTLPLSFCWTRFGTEAGETIEEILARKETERQANNGVFFWGIGNSIAPAVGELVRRVDEPEVLFSPIKGRPHRVDVAPDNVVRWTSAQGLTGDAFDLPSHATVTSRWDPSRRAGAHYALVCMSADPLEITNTARLDVAGLRNLRSGAPIGASQVTAVVARAAAHHEEGGYAVAFRATLVAPYFVRLRQPVTLDGRQQQPIPFAQLTL